MDNYKLRAKAFREGLEEKLSKANLEENTMRTFKITIEEQCSQTFEVEATDMEEAMEIAEQKYADGTFVLNDPCLTYKCMMGEDEETGEMTEWVGF